jgi:hypothetical protein
MLVTASLTKSVVPSGASSQAMMGRRAMSSRARDSGVAQRFLRLAQQQRR